jgi:hypothetical protein
LTFTSTSAYSFTSTCTSLAIFRKGSAPILVEIVKVYDCIFEYLFVVALNLTNANKQHHHTDIIHVHDNFARTKHLTSPQCSCLNAVRIDQTASDLSNPSV